MRDAVTASGKSLREFATERRIAYSTLRYYHDKRLEPLSQPPRKDTLRELALALDVPLGDLEQAALESLSYRAAPRKPRPEPASSDGAPQMTVEDAIRADSTLAEIAKAHLLSQVALLRHLRDGLPPELEQEQAERKRAAIANGRRLEALPVPSHEESMADSEETLTSLAALSDEDDTVPSSPSTLRPSRRK